MRLEEAKRKYQAGEIQIHFDDKSKSELLDEFCKGHCGMDYYKKSSATYYQGRQFMFKDLPIVNISEIEEEVVWQKNDLQYRLINGEWKDLHIGNVEFRLKPKPEYSKEIEALQQKAKENGMKAIITFEKI